ncbi:von Willebrand factor A domain-containing protein 8-like [Saccostrea cucullata]|uniref:von Willebrand factor A domain-containing protein 8-like n=1 Tax=Saccostrea cuccullata TaxID=36930 RepID=UPI002ED4DE66
MSWLRRMSVNRSNSRLQVLRNILRDGPQKKDSLLTIRRCSSQTEGGAERVSIGDISIATRQPANVEVVPVRHLQEKPPQAVLHHLKWIMQKDGLKQDVFLIGGPGPLRRQVAMMYLELTRREVEYVSLSRDTTETDIKQRREIVSGTAYYHDQPAVKAAIQGRVLVLEGIEKAERNVLPILNNLLENREMQLDDGRFLMSAERYDKLLTDHSKEELDALKLVRVDENFRVIALGHPVPRYRGNALDPPLRSRFQARDINALPFTEQLECLQEEFSGIPTEKISQILSFGAAVNSQESSALGLPDFPISNISGAVKMLKANSNLDVTEVIDKLYPFTVILNKEGIASVKNLLTKFSLKHKDKYVNKGQITSVENKNDNLVSVETNTLRIDVIRGCLETNGNSESFIPTPYHNSVLVELIEAHAAQDFCIIGSRGCGKSILVERFAQLLGYELEPIMLYQDMTSRDLLQKRITEPNGDTTWMMSPLVEAALNGRLAVLDGLHRINQGSFAVLHRLIHDRELQLFDGTRLLRNDRYEQIKTDNELTDQDMKDRQVYPIHPSFRIVALSEPPVPGSASQQWMTPEMLTMFLFHHLRPLSLTEEKDVVTKVVLKCPDLGKLLNFVHYLRKSTDPALVSISASLSTRQLIRIARRLANFPSKDLHGIIQKACMSSFLPRLPRDSLEQTMEAADIKEIPKQEVDTNNNPDRLITCSVKDGTLTIGDTSVPVFNPENKTKVPDVLFYENPQHLAVMEDMLKDFVLGEHLLLVGNQGVGKNKIVDRFLHLMNRPREYIQLHRDTTVQTLTLQPTVKDGIIVFEDSPLVRAVKMGHVLVVDEADKAPTHVTCILKTLIESGEMHLADGRRIVSHKSGHVSLDNTIVGHPDFRMIVLANRPGFPFLGNDFFGAMGDIFSCHAILNPDMESEMSMLQQYGPNVSKATLEKLVNAFGELRNMADQGLISYPYSTREVVNIVRHMEKYPNDGLRTVVKNVFDFDAYSKELQETIIKTMHKHGVPYGISRAEVNLAKKFPLPPFTKVGTWTIQRPEAKRRTAMMSLPVETSEITIKGPVEVFPQSLALDKNTARASLFTEQESYWTIPMHETNVISDVSVTKATNQTAGKFDIVHIVTANPIGLFSVNPKLSTCTVIDLYDMFPSTTGSYRPRVRIAPLAEPLDSNVFLHEEVTNSILVVNFNTGEVCRLSSHALPEMPIEKRRFPATVQTPNPYRMCPSTLPDAKGTILFYKEGGDNIVAVTGKYAHSVDVPLVISRAHQAGADQWLLSSDKDEKFLVKMAEDNSFSLYPINESGDSAVVRELSSVPLNDAHLKLALKNDDTGPNRTCVLRDSYVSIMQGFPDSAAVDVYSSPREPLPESKSQAKEIISTPAFGLFGSSTAKPEVNPTKRSHIVCLPESGQIVEGLPTWKVPESALSSSERSRDVSGYLEVIDPVHHVLRYIPVPPATRQSPYLSWMSPIADSKLFVAPMSEDGLVTVDVGGCIRTWETALVNLERSLREWKNMMGFDDGKQLQITKERESGRKADGPKHGKIDPKNAPHHGGNTWAGGTGGSNTAGLGGIGGPYRLDAGHKVYQVPQHEKDSVPDHVREAARDMARKAFKERLREINMSEYDADVYEGFSKNVRNQVSSLRVILDSLQAKGKERQWLKNQAYGDLDDSKLIEGITGEKSIYKRRGEKDPELGTPQEKPKRIRLLVDVSGSMYRFNGYDGRLNREMEATLMMMEALEKYEDKFKYDIYGHSGEDHKVVLVDKEKVPTNNKERLIVLKTMHAHSQFCMSGDTTLMATKHASDELAQEEADEHFLIILSDANFDRYGISPRKFGEILKKNEKVNAYVVFIGSLEDQASQLIRQLPTGHAFICLDTTNLPQILQQIFTSTMLSGR